MKIVASSGLFDAAHYLRQHTDASGIAADPVAHWVRWGVAQRLDPSPWFNTAFYLSRYPDVASSGVNPLQHFIEHGHRERRNPHPDFDTDFYLRSNPDVAMAGINPLLHFVQWGKQEGRPPSATSSRDLNAEGLTGWIIAPRPVERVRLSTENRQQEFAIGTWRPDVYDKMKSRHRVPLEHAMFCGVVNGSKLSLGNGPLHRLSVAVKFDTGQWLELGSAQFTAQCAATLSSAWSAT
jgi:hypothetical protein